MRDGKLLAEIRERYGFNREDFAERLDLGPSTVRDWETRRKPGVTGIGKMLTRLAGDESPLAIELRAWATGPPPPEKQKPPVPTTAENESPATPVPSSAATTEPSLEAVLAWVRDDVGLDVLQEQMYTAVRANGDERGGAGWSYPVPDTLRTFKFEPPPSTHWWTAREWLSSPAARLAIFRQVLQRAEQARGLSRPAEVRSASQGLTEENIDGLIARLEELRRGITPPPGDYRLMDTLCSIAEHLQLSATWGDAYPKMFKGQEDG